MDSQMAIEDKLQQGSSLLSRKASYSGVLTSERDRLPLQLPSEDFSATALSEGCESWLRKNAPAGKLQRLR